MFESQKPTIALESGTWSLPGFVPAIDSPPTFVENESLVERIRRSRIAKFVQLLILLRHLFTDRQHLLLSQLSEIFGDRFRIRLGLTNLVILADPNSIQEALEKGHEEMSAGSGRKRLIGIFPEHSLFYAKGERQPIMRRVVARAFGLTTKNFDLNREFGRLVLELKTVHGHDRAQAIENELIQIAGKFVFGTANPKIDQLARKLLNDFNKLHTAAFVFPCLKLIPRFGNGVKQFKGSQKVLLEQIENAIECGTPDDSFLARLQQTSNGQLTQQEIRDNAAFFFLVIVRTLVSLFRNVIHTLAMEAKWQNKLRFENAEKNNLFRATVKETLRLNPFIPVFVRRANKDQKLDGYDVKKGEQILIAPWIAHYRETSFKNPSQFNPNRFMGRRSHAYRFIAFGGGKNHCIGGGWSVELISQLMEHLLDSFRLDLVDRGHSNPNRLSFRAFFLLRREDEIAIEPV